MKLLITGDWHLTDKTPRCRVDDYVSAQRKKIEFIMKTAEEKECSYILQPGDLTDSWFSKDEFKVKWIDFFKEKINHHGEPKIVSIFGQHDMRYHTSNISNTPLGVLRAGIGFALIEDELPLISNGIDIYGSGWGRPIPKILRENSFNILITHRMIVADKLWAGQEKYEVAGTFLRRYGFDLVVSGDNHTTFFYYWKGHGKYLINCGSLMRNRIDQLDHKPTIFIFDVEAREIEEIQIPVAPFKTVVDLVEVEKEESHNKKLEELRDALKKKTKIRGLDYRKRVFNRVEFLKNSKTLTLNSRTEKFIGRIMRDE